MKRPSVSISVKLDQTVLFALESPKIPLHHNVARVKALVAILNTSRFVVTTESGAKRKSVPMDVIKPDQMDLLAKLMIQHALKVPVFAKTEAL